jgi:hypothetical protein
MRLLVIGPPDGELAAASTAAVHRGATLTQSDGGDGSVVVMRASGAGLVLIDGAHPIATLLEALAAERIRTPAVTGAVGSDGPGAVRAMREGPRTRAESCAAGAITSRLVGRTVADVEQDLILDTLDHCLGNRTHAAKILGISIRTLRNKLNDYAAAGVAVPEPGQR